MQLKLYSVYDKKTSIYHPAIYCHNEGDAVRMITTISRNPKSNLHNYPEDFQIFEIGAFDDQSGKITPIPEVRFVCSISDLDNQSKL